MTEEIFHPLTTGEASRLAELEKTIESNEVAALSYVTALREIRDQRLYRATHRTFELYCAQRFGKTADAIGVSIKALGIREELLADTERVKESSKPILRAFGEGSSAKAVLETAKIKQEKRVETIIEASKIAAGKKVTARHVQAAAAKLGHRPMPVVAKPTGFAACYGAGAVASNAGAKADTGKPLTLEEFRRQVSALNVPASARIVFEDEAGRTPLHRMSFDRVANELSME